ncbi:hypothetical protein NPX13_g1426 [Xylaria arbuscula]|uniref:Xylanolytic transcriptional activator regulatory domain-containing protein n=1 Tax=Xylaria arbuscula TaxID=114810 RepID=A0A9W8TRV2_9PEZI|nr:hypothetical protein NPX13_g1426 [Xylaria arbuscula]
MSLVTDEILARLERLESIVLPKGGNRVEDIDSPTILDTPQSSNSAQDSDLHLLENIGVREDDLISSLSDDLSFVISSVDSILRSQDDARSTGTFGLHSRRGIIMLPLYETAVILYNYFEDNLSHMCPILNFLTIRSLIKSIYTRISQKQPILPSPAALLLSSFALSAFFHHPIGNIQQVTSIEDATILSKYWSRGALDALEHSRRNTSGTLEDVQALIIMSYVMYHLDGFSARYRHLSSTAISMARDLGLHRLDADQGLPTNQNPNLQVLIDREVKRRVYWHLIASDWTQSTMTGPQEGTYTIHPNHIQVTLPTEYEDGSSPGDDLVTRPTGITFLLARIRLAELSREYTDTIPLDTLKVLRIPYKDIISLDEKIKSFLIELPYFFRSDDESRTRSKALETVYTKIPIMRYCILTAAHTRRCRLHQKFLIRMASNLEYHYSRQACLESARAVIQLYREPRSEADSPLMETARMAMAVHYTHLALVIQVMDLCFNKNEPDYDERKDELFATLQMLQGARSISPLLNCSLDSVTEVLRKHHVYLSMDSVTDTTIQQQLSKEIAYPPGDFETHYAQYGFGFGEGSFTIDPSINEFWQNANQFQMDLDSNNWDSLFSNLESGPL